jgi:Flp pilus assembly pilin Flp
MRAVKLLGDPARNQRGAAAVEFALLLTPFLMVTFGIIELGSYGMVQLALLESVHAGTIRRCSWLEQQLARDHLFPTDHGSEWQQRADAEFGFCNGDIFAEQ